MRTYHTLLIKEAKGDNWSIAFGDYKKSVVMDEREDSYSDCYKTRIISTADNQQAIDAEVARLNAKTK